MRVLITGATGTIGLALADALRDARRPGGGAVARSRARPAGAGRRTPRSMPGHGPPRRRRRRTALRGADAVVHLLGEPIAQRWTDEAKVAIRDSRVLGHPVAGARR